MNGIKILKLAAREPIREKVLETIKHLKDLEVALFAAKTVTQEGIEERLIEAGKLLREARKANGKAELI